MGQSYHLCNPSHSYWKEIIKSIQGGAPKIAFSCLISGFMVDITIVNRAYIGQKETSLVNCYITMERSTVLLMGIVQRTFDWAMASIVFCM